MLPLAVVLAPGKFSVLVKGTEKKRRRALCSIAACQFEKPVGTAGGDVQEVFL